LELSAKRGAGERKLRRRTQRPRGERRRLRRAKRGPCVRGSGERLGSRNTALRPQRLELLRAQLAEAAERRPSRERVDDDQLRRRSDVVCERERVEKLQLVVEVVLEPEDDLHARPQGVDVFLVAARETGEERAAASPAAVGEER